ncbi:MAG: GNAT family N-acetyltransferase [Kosmotoga sp.]|uniref:GNAT family N-acetyltransferase n=1 Tax=Kosmotoga sp. TaxID=1955248 RepID=UPI001DB33663|nr:GNAT family N-acetyltransferase [Kosmotoga sp.]MBO8166670.1 GNAT family N-acetyltransferase [Kosmotoga sp.]
MYEYRKSEDVNSLMEMAYFSFAVKRQEQELIKKFIDYGLSNGTEIYGVYDSDKLVAAYLLYPFQMRLRNSIVPVGGIGMVCSRPDYRRKGVIRFMIKKSIETMRSKDMVASILYPFNVNFYRKYGWELFFRKKVVSFNPALLMTKEDSSVAVEYLKFPDKDCKEFYNKHARKEYNMVLRDGHHWEKQLELSNSEASNGIVKFEKDGKIVGIMALYLSGGETMFESIATVKDFIYNDRNTKEAMLNYLKTLSLQVSKLKMVLPENFILWPYLSDQPSEEKTGNAGMIRIVSMEKLDGLAVNFELESLIVSVNDEFSGENSGNFEIKTEKGLLKISKSSKSSEITCDIGCFSSVISGFTNFKEMIEADRVQVFEGYKEQDMPKVTTFNSEPF